MNEHNTYPVFVADQVLTADHLNQVVNYLDEQGRLTRNRLIGIGIVCGLEIQTGPGRIGISNGCGVTSEGYLILQEHKVCTWFRPYSLPEYFSPEYKSVYEHWQIWELLSAEESLEVEDPRPLEGSGDFLEDKVVVLLLEMKEKPLKNCVEIDCEDKGEKTEFRVRTLLVSRENLDAFMGHREDTSDALPAPVLKLRRFNVPARELKNTNDVFGAFLRMVSEPTLKKLAEALNVCFERYQPVLGVEHNPFVHVAGRFADTISHIKSANPFFIQYFYDWIDDIVKGYNELEHRIFDVQVACCPDRDLFPLHLMLGEASRSTADQLKAPYRHHFIYSPLFGRQKDRLAEVQQLFRRLVTMVESFQVPDARRLFTAGLKITPSRYLQAPLSKRCIPYYYDPDAMYPLWSREKTRRGRARENLSYHAVEYSEADTIVNPLNYDLDPFDFFRVEGHIGKPVKTALPALTGQRNEFNLPFEVVALSTATISAFFDESDHDCHFRDLEALYQVLLAEMKCKFGSFECRAAKIPYEIRLAAGDFFHATEITRRNTVLEERVGGTESLATDSLATGRYTAVRTFRPGDFLRSHCAIAKGSVGEAYLSAVNDQVSFGRVNTLKAAANAFGTSATFDLSAGTGTAAEAASAGTDTAAGAASAGTSGATTIGMAANTVLHPNVLYAALFYFIHSVEQMMGELLDKSLDELDIAAFHGRYATVMDAAGDLARVGDLLERLDTGNNYDALPERLRTMGFYELALRIHALLPGCFDDRLRAMKEEYQRRIRELRLLTNLMHYAKKHPGLEHKAGVSRGGTFILVYHETPSRRAMANLHFKNESDNPIREAYVNDPGLLRNFEKALNRFMGACRDMDVGEKDRIRDILVRIPREEAPLKFQVPEEAVIADLYLPYICCSDCAPVSYVLPVPPRETLSIDVKPTEFCNDDQRVYPVNVSPTGGQLTASAGGVSSESGFFFSPLGLNGGVNTLTYTLADGRSTSIDLLIAENFKIDFKTKETGNQSIQFFPGFSEDDREVLWDFGDGTTSAEFSPVHTYQFAEQEAHFAVTLSVTNAPCKAGATQTVTVRRPVDPEFTLKPNVFCVKDKKTYEFGIAPFPASVAEIDNPSRLMIALDEAGKKLSFTPAKHRIRASRDYHLEYLGKGLDVRIVVPDASFIMQIQWLDVDSLLVLRPKKTDATNYEWIISQGQNNHRFESPRVEVKLSELKIHQGRNFTISLRVNYQLPSGNCIDEQKFVMTRAIFGKYQGSGQEFDNTTTS